MSKSTDESSRQLTRVVAIYRVRAERLDHFMTLLGEHHPTLRGLGLATDEPPTVYRGFEDDGGPIVFEIFEWADPEAPGRAHHTPEVARIWEAMGVACEERDGRPKFMFPHVEPVDLGATAG